MLDPVDFFKRIEEQLEQSKPFVVFHKPGDQTIKAYLQHRDRAFAVKNYAESGFVFAPFDNSKEAILFPLKESDCIETVSELSIPESIKELIPLEEDQHLKAVHLKNVANAVQSIQKGEFSKVVMSRKQTIKRRFQEPLTIFKKIVNQYPGAFGYFLYHPKGGMWMGATPETLFTQNGKTITTMSLAGTRKYNPEEKDQWGSKEKGEQQIVTDAITEALQDWTEQTQITGPHTVRAGSLLHLRTDITSITTDRASVGDIINALHPTPATCGFPKEVAKKYILEHEGYDREFYTGFLGELITDAKGLIEHAHLFVNLRCMQIKQEVVNIYVGGGITADSEPVSEWNETINKLRTMLDVLE